MEQKMLDRSEKKTFVWRKESIKIKLLKLLKLRYFWTNILWKRNSFPTNHLVWRSLFFFFDWVERPRNRENCTTWRAICLRKGREVHGTEKNFTTKRTSYLSRELLNGNLYYNNKPYGLVAYFRITEVKFCFFFKRKDMMSCILHF